MSLLNNSCKEIQEIVEFIETKAKKLPLGRFTNQQILIYILEAIRDKTIRTLRDRGGYLRAIIILRLNSYKENNIWIEQIFTDGTPKTMAYFLLQLSKEFPRVEEAFGYRQKSKRVVRFKLQTLKKIYGW